MAGELTPRDLRRLAGNGDSEIVEPRRLFRGQDLGETPFLRRKLQQMSLLADGLAPQNRGMTRRQGLQAMTAALGIGGAMATRGGREWMFGTAANAAEPSSATRKRHAVTGPLTLAPPDLTGTTTTPLSDSTPNVAERTDLSSLGGNGIMVQPGKSTSPFKLQAIYDYWMKHVYIRGVNPDVGRSPQIFGTAFDLDYWEMSLDWTVVCEDVWTNKYAQSTGKPIPDGVEADWAYWTNRNTSPPVIPAGVTIRADPPGGGFCDPKTIGVGYVNTVGYTGEPQPKVTQRTVA